MKKKNFQKTIRSSYCSLYDGHRVSGYFAGGGQSIRTQIKECKVCQQRHTAHLEQSLKRFRICDLPE